MAQVGVCWMCPEEYAGEGVEVETSKEELLAHTEALFMSRVGGNSPFLILGDL